MQQGCQSQCFMNKKKPTAGEMAGELAAEIARCIQDSPVQFHELNTSIKLATYQVLEYVEADPYNVSEAVVGEILRQLWAKATKRE
jgi:hypothetical protein